MDQEKNAYDIAHERATNPATREEFWKDEMEKVFWYEKPKNILDSSNPPFYRWFKDGKTNMCYNCIDRWCETMPGEKALIYESPMANTSKIYTYRDLKDHVSRLAGALHQLNVKVGDRVIIYMPMIPEALMAQYACCRIGAIHSVVFGGFAAKELASRILDAKPKVIITASCGIEPHRIVDYKTILDEALNQAGAHDTKVILYQRPEHRANNIENGRDLDYHTVMQFSQPVDCVPVVSDHPLYILYTSGTTGTPKGIVRDTGGTIVALNWTMEHIMDIHQKEVYFSSSDIGWVVGHSFITYGPLIRGAATILYEGKPTGTPNPGAYWRLIETHKVSGFYTAPTALRALKKEDPDGAWIKKYNTSTLKAISFAGERCDIPTFDWLQGNLPNVLLNDNYWQTEIGWIISCNYKNLHTFKSIPGTATKPCPGFSIDILNDQNQKVKTNELGRVCCKLPMPPSFMLTLWQNDDAFVSKYLKESPGYYTSGDAGYIDDEGYLHVMARLDDIINTAGHRLSTAAMEEVLLGHKDICDAAVVSARDELKGEIPVGFVCVKPGHRYDADKLKKDLIKNIREDIGPVAAFRVCIIVDKLPKTRSGKILRHILKKMVDGQKYQAPATIEDSSILGDIEEMVLKSGLGKKADIQFEEDIEPSSPFKQAEQLIVEEPDNFKLE